MSVLGPDIWDYGRSQFVAWVVGDFQPSNADKLAVAAMVSANSPDIILSHGDTSDAGNFAVSMAAYQDWVDRHLFYPAPGNHDQTTTLGIPDYCATYFAYYHYLDNQYYYQLSLGPVDIFMLHSYGLNPDGYAYTSRMAEWFTRSLAVSEAPWKIAFFHHAAYSSSTTHGSSAWMQWPQFATLDAVFSGHDHVYERNKVGDTYYFTNGMAGSDFYSFGTPLATSQFRYNQSHGAMRLEFTQNRLNMRFVNVHNVVIDEVELTK